MNIFDVFNKICEFGSILLPINTIGFIVTDFYENQYDEVIAVVEITLQNKTKVLRDFNLDTLEEA